MTVQKSWILKKLRPNAARAASYIKIIEKFCTLFSGILHKFELNHEEF